ncbi:MAG: ACP S-malonyltransferase [Andreesenia angusta]|nr:ACP S-malonyltransferase [Andreesenia angusta]
MKNIAFLFPGQGAQYIGMGKSLYENFDIAKKIVETTEEIIGFDLKKIIFDGDEEELKKTEIAQPSIVMVSHMVCEILKSKGIEARAVAGLSLGEYSALIEANSIDYRDGIDLVRKRGLLMEKAVPFGKGKMSAIIGLDKNIIEEVVGELTEKGIIEIANYNCPGQIVISGEAEIVDEANIVLKEKGAKRCIPLSVSGPFHTEMLLEAGEELREILEKIEIKKPDKDIYLNITGEKFEDEDLVDNLVNQISSSIMFEDIIRNMIRDGIEIFIEVGVGKTLSSFVKKTAKSEGVKVKTLNADEYETIEKVINSIQEG